jgi:hypothetical protein
MSVVPELSVSPGTLIKTYQDGQHQKTVRTSLLATVSPGRETKSIREQSLVLERDGLFGGSDH